MLDEITEPGGDTTSSGGSETTSEEPQTFTASQAKALADKARSDALAEVGRLKKAFDESQRLAAQVLKRLQEREEADLRRDEEAARDDPGQLAILRARHAEQKARSEADAERQKREAKVAESEERNREILGYRAKELAVQYNVTADLLLKYGGTGKDTMEDLAKSFGERKATGNSTTRVTNPPDSGKTAGGGKPLTREEVAKMTPEEQNRRRSEIAKMSFI